MGGAVSRYSQQVAGFLLDSLVARAAKATRVANTASLLRRCSLAPCPRHMVQMSVVPAVATIDCIILSTSLMGAKAGMFGYYNLASTAGVGTAVAAAAVDKVGGVDIYSAPDIGVAAVGSGLITAVKDFADGGARAPGFVVGSAQTPRTAGFDGITDHALLPGSPVEIAMPPLEG